MRLGDSGLTHNCHRVHEAPAEKSTGVVLGKNFENLTVSDLSCLIALPCLRLNVIIPSLSSPGKKSFQITVRNELSKTSKSYHAPIFPYFFLEV